MQTDNKFFDDLAKLAGGGMGMLMDMKREIEAMVTGQMEKMMSRMNLVTRDEFDAVREMATQARIQQEALLQQITALEAQIASLKAKK